MRVANILVFILCSTITFAQGRFDKVEIKSTALTDNIYMLQGAGGNMALLKGNEGHVLVDDQFAELSEKIKKAIAEIADHPVKYLINTHWHGDHTGGNKNFAETGATIIAHHNVRERLSTEQIRPFRKPTPPSDPLAWPELTFNDELSLHFNGENIKLIHVQNAHTDGDAFVYFSNSNVLHMGDCFFKDRYPFIDIDLGGTVDGYIRAVSTALLICNDNTQIIPGHGELANKEDLQKYLDTLMTLRERMQVFIDQGKKLEEIPVSEVTQGFTGWGDGFINDETIVKTLFSDLTK